MVIKLKKVENTSIIKLLTTTEEERKLQPQTTTLYPLTLKDSNKLKDIN